MNYDTLLIKYLEKYYSKNEIDAASPITAITIGKVKYHLYRHDRIIVEPLDYDNISKENIEYYRQLLSAQLKGLEFAYNNLDWNY